MPSAPAPPQNCDRPLLFAAGGAHLDRRGQMAGDYIPGASNPGWLREEIGGGAFNAARSSIQRGVSVSFMSLRGGDAAGAAVAAAIDRAGLADFSCVFLDRATPSYTALIRQDGTLVAGLADMELYELAFARQFARRKLRDAIGLADAVLLDANLPEAAIAALLHRDGGKPCFAIAVSPAKVVRLAGFLDRLAVVFMNLREARALAGAGPEATASQCVARLIDLGLAAGVITDGARSVTIFEGHTIEAKEPPPTAIIDETGAGDALAGATIAAIMKGSSLMQAVSEGMAAARLALATPSAVPELKPKTFKEALRVIVNAGKRIDPC